MCYIFQLNLRINNITSWGIDRETVPDFIFEGSKITAEGRSQDGGGIGLGDHFLSYKFIEGTIELWTNLTKQLLIASRGHQAPRKATHCLRREVGQNIKDKKGDKELGTGKKLLKIQTYGGQTTRF